MRKQIKKTVKALLSLVVIFFMTQACVPTPGGAQPSHQLTIKVKESGCDPFNNGESRSIILYKLDSSSYTPFTNKTAITYGAFTTTLGSSVNYDFTFDGLPNGTYGYQYYKIGVGQVWENVTIIENTPKTVSYSIGFCL
jgi:hypothetical protein